MIILEFPQTFYERDNGPKESAPGLWWRNIQLWVRIMLAGNKSQNLKKKLILAILTNKFTNIPRSSIFPGLSWVT